MKLPPWITVDGRVQMRDGQAFVNVTVHTEQPAFWQEVVRMAWSKYGAYWWHPVFWRGFLPILWRLARATWRQGR